MALTFPNPSRSFDERRKAVRFSGYDGMFEIPFLVDAAALVNTAGGSTKSIVSESTLLSAFDAARTSIYEVAREAYSHDRRTLYTLTSANFR